MRDEQVGPDALGHGLRARGYGGSVASQPTVHGRVVGRAAARARLSEAPVSRMRIGGPCLALRQLGGGGSSRTRHHPEREAAGEGDG